MHESSGSTDEQPCNRLLDRITALEERVTELETTCEQQQEDFHALAREKHELRTSHERLEKSIDQAEAKQDELDERIDRAETSRGHILDDIIDVENQLDEIETTSAGPTSGDDDGTIMQRSDMTPIERLSKMNVEDTGIDVTPSIERAVSIFDHWHEWSGKTPKGRVLKSGLKTLLRTATGERLAWRQVYRACEALDELSKGRIEFFNHNKHGKMLIESEPARNGHCHSSSAATS